MKLTVQQPPYKCLVNWQFDARASKVTSLSFMPPLVPAFYHLGKMVAFFMLHPTCLTCSSLK